MFFFCVCKAAFKTRKRQHVDISQYHEIQNPRSYTVSYHKNDITSVYCSALIYNNKSTLKLFESEYTVHSILYLCSGISVWWRHCGTGQETHCQMLQAACLPDLKGSKKINPYSDILETFLSCFLAVQSLRRAEGIMTITTGGYNGFNMASAQELVPWVPLTVLCSKALSIMKQPK